MPDQLQLRGGTTTEHNTFTGVTKEVTVDTTKKTLVVHDGSTAGGTPLMKESGSISAGNITLGANYGTRFRIMDGMVSSRVDYGIARTAGGYTFREVDEGSERAGIHSNASNDLIFKTGAEQTVMTLDGSYLGIGTTSPNSIFHVQPLNETNFLIRNEGQFIVLASETNSGRDNNRGMDFEAEQYRFICSGSNKVFIKSTGDVGIGSDAPTAKLDIARLGAAWTGSSPVSGTALHMHNGNNATTSPVYLGLGAGSQSMSGINFGDEDDADVGRIHYSHSDNSLRFGTNGSSERVRIDTDGNLGINTTNVQARLHIKSTLSDTNALVKLESYHPKIRFHDLSGSARGGEILMDGDALRFHVSVPVDDATALDEKMRLDENGRLLIGRTTGDFPLDVNGGARISESFYMANDKRIQWGGSNVAYIEGNDAETIKFGIANEKIRLDNNGALTSRVYEGNANGGDYWQLNQSAGGSAADATLEFFASSTDERFVCGFNRRGSNVGAISVSSSGTTYATSSDYRLKENIVTLSDAITRLKTLKPYRFNFKNDTDTTVDGFLAHEVTAVPEAVTGTKDQVDADNNPVYQGIDQSKLVPLLVAAVQELIGKVETLEAA